MSNFVGQPMTRVDGRAKVTGKAKYSAEEPIPRLVYARLVMSTIAKGRVESIDIAPAERIPGVLAVMTPFNTPKLPPKPSGSNAVPTKRELTPLQDNFVRYANQPVAMVIADTFENARHAASILKVRYASETHHTSFESSKNTSFKPETVGGAKEKPDTNDGDLAAGLARANAKIQHVYTTPCEVHNPMEMHATIATWEGTDKLTLYDATQGVCNDRQRVAEVLGLKPDNVRVISEFLGGGFGSKGPTWTHVVLCAMAAKQVNRPVKLMLSRNQMFGPVGMRSETRQTVTAGATNDGTLTALSHDTVAQTSTFDTFMETASITTRMLYACPNIATTHRLLRSDIGTPSFMRAPGETPGNFGLECAMDEMAYAVKMDPLAFRIKNYAEQDDPEKKRPWSSKSLNECYRVGAERFGWSKRPMEPRSMKDGHALIGWGMATAVYPTRRSKATAVARIGKDGHVLVESATQDLGTGTYTVMTQIAADSIGASPDQVTFRLGDTEYPEAPVSGGSQTAASTGSAVYLAGQALREKLIQAASTDSRSPLSGVGAGDVVIDAGRIFVRGNSTKGETLQSLMARHQGEFIEGHGDAQPGEEKDKYSMYAFGAQFAEVRVDADLGQIRVSRMVGVFGAGKILNAKTARNQLMGGMTWGISAALLEDAVMDHRLGRFVNNNFAEYHIPVNLDTPAIDASWVNEVDEHVNPIGVKGIGEIGITGSVAAITNAVYHATGKRVRDLPITLDKLL